MEVGGRREGEKRHVQTFIIGYSASAVRVPAETWRPSSYVLCRSFIQFSKAIFVLNYGYDAVQHTLLIMC